MNEMNTNTQFPFRTVLMTVLVSAVVTILAVYLSGHLLTGSRNANENMDASDHTHEKTTHLYTCGMHPWIVQEGPGNCPICGMKLTPKRSESKGGVEIRIDPVTEQNMGVRTALVKKGELVHTIRTYGHITYDETRTVQISPRFNGWIVKLYVDFTGKQVEKGDPLFDIYSPELITVQDEYLEAFKNARQYPGKTGEKFLSSVKRKLKFFDLTDVDIHNIEISGKARDTITIRSPATGVVIHKKAVEGGFVMSGQNIYTLSDLSRVWVEAHIYEYELPLIRIGLDAIMTLPYLPGKEYKGKVTFVTPYLQEKTRDVIIRLEFDNTDLVLKPDMYADVLIQTKAEKEGITIPSESVIRSGDRNVVFVSRGEGKFSPRDVTLGMSLDDGMVQVLTGVAPGEIIVTSGQFMLDSESKLKEAVMKMMEAKNPESNKKKETDDFFNDF
ncbi:MAG: efflux RND transporter periplasmic adaptor subunit [Proteobacteria bacterium]|nr:efflux RND transporter periplasmic adaptor subunit [Pseudomonadota bacterium]